MLQIRIVTTLAARDSGVNTCNLRKLGSQAAVRTVTRGRFMPDEGEIVSDMGVRRIDGWVLCHLRFRWWWLAKVKEGGGMLGVSASC